MALIAHADTTYEGAIWTYVEPCIGLVCACLPIIRGLFPVYSVKKRSTYGKRCQSPAVIFRNPNGSMGHSTEVNAPYFAMESSRNRSLLAEEERKNKS